MEHPGAAGLDAAVIGIDRLGSAVSWDCRIVDEQHGIVMHGEAVGLEAEHIVGTPVADRRSDVALAVHGVGRDQPPLKVKELQEGAQGRDRAGSAGTPIWPCASPLAEAKALISATGELARTLAMAARSPLPSIATTPSAAAAWVRRW